MADIYGSKDPDRLIGTDADDEIFGFGGDDLLDGGLGGDIMWGGDGDDTYFVDDAADQALERPGGGTDTVATWLAYYVLGADIERLSYMGASTLGFTGTGNALDNDIEGWNGNDRLDGGAGADTLRGHGGNDLYWVDDAGDRVIEAAGGGVDGINTTLAALTLADNVEQLFYQGPATGAFRGTGNALANRIEGLQGHDTLDGGGGADTLIGRGGDDIYRVDDFSDTVVEAEWEGVDTVFASVSYLLPANVENLFYTGPATIGFTGRGNALANSMVGGDGHDYLDGMGGADRLSGRGGHDRYVVDDIGDIVVEEEGGGYDIVYTTLLTYTIPDHVEEALHQGSGLGVNITGNALDNGIGGSAGHDRLDGGLGADLMVGGLGNDIYTVDDAGDEIRERSGEGVDRVHSMLAAWTLHDDIEHLHFIGHRETSFTGIGNALDNRMWGKDAADRLEGLGGADFLDGGYGGDTLLGGDGDDALLGGIGGDFLDGGAGADIMYGLEDDDIYIVDDLADICHDYAGQGNDEIRTALADYTLPDHVETLTGTRGSAQTLRGNSGANTIVAGAANDILRLEQGGDDAALGGAGNDTFIFGAALTAADRVDGGAGDRDQLGIQGNYVLTFGAASLVGIETLALLSGRDTRFGDPGTGLYGYSLTAIDSNVAAGRQLVVNMNALQAGENVFFDGSAETDGNFFFYGGAGADHLIGGAGGDSFFFGAGLFSASDRIVGGNGAGRDQLGLRGDYSLAFAADTMRGIETIALVSGKDGRFGAAGPDFDYSIATHDSNVAAGQQLSVNGADLAASERLVFDGSAETDGAFRILGGRGDDSLTGGTGNDTLYGGLGRDALAGAGGADTFVYRSAAESTGAGYDTIQGFDFAADRLDLPGVHDVFERREGGTLREASFDADLAAAIGPLLQPGDAAFFTATAGDLSGRTFLVVDLNGVDGYQPGADLVIQLPAAPPPGAIPDFIV